jgi:hypothetical protein
MEQPIQAVVLKLLLNGALAVMAAGVWQNLIPPDC